MKQVDLSGFRRSRPRLSRSKIPLERIGEGLGEGPLVASLSAGYSSLFSAAVRLARAACACTIPAKIAAYKRLKFPKFSTLKPKVTRVAEKSTFVLCMCRLLQTSTPRQSVVNLTSVNFLFDNQVNCRKAKLNFLHNSCRPSFVSSPPFFSSLLASSFPVGSDFSLPDSHACLLTRLNLRVIGDYSKSNTYLALQGLYTHFSQSHLWPRKSAYRQVSCISCSLASR